MASISITYNFETQAQLSAFVQSVQAGAAASTEKSAEKTLPPTASPAASKANGKAAAPPAASEKTAEKAEKVNVEKVTEVAPTVTREVLLAGLNKYKADAGTDEAKKLIFDVTGAKQLADVQPGDYAKLYKAANDAYDALVAAKKPAAAADDDL